MLCGEEVPGARTYSSVLTASIFSDLGTTPGIVEYSWTNKGTTQAFKFRPSTVSGVKQVTGNLIVDPISVGGDEVGQNMTSDLEWAIVGTPVLSAPAVEDETFSEEDAEATGARTRGRSRAA